MKFNFITFLTFGVCFCFPQSTKADIVIEYVIYVEQDNPLIDRALIVPERVTFAFSEKFVRVTTISKSAMADHFDLYKLEQDFYFFCMDFLGQKKAYKIKKDQYEIRYSNDSVYSIIGYPCRKAYGIKAATDSKVEIFYTDYFGIKFFPYGELNGIALKYTRTDAMFKSITYEAVSMQAGKLPDDVFSMAGFKISYFKAEPKKRTLLQGKQLPLLKATNLDGTENTLVTAGKITVVNYWFLGCSPCRMEIPFLNLLVKKFEGNQEVQFIAIALDKPEEIAKFLKAGNIFEYQLLANGRKAATKSKIESYPTHFIVDQSGKVIDEWQSYTPITVFEMNKRIEEIITK